MRQCDTYQRNKSKNSAPASLLHPLPIPEGIWEDLSMDFISGLPNPQGKNTTFVIVDLLSKYAHFIALAHPYTALTVAQLFWTTFIDCMDFQNLL